MKALFFFILVSVSLKSVAMNDCFSSASEKYDIQKELLMAVAITESNLDQGARNENKTKDGRVTSYDVGVFQINNKVWFEYFELMGVSRKDIIEDACTNIHAGAYILRYQFDLLGRDDWDAVGTYNVGFQRGSNIEKIKERYIARVKKNYKALFGE